LSGTRFLLIAAQVMVTHGLRRFFIIFFITITIGIGAEI